MTWSDELRISNSCVGSRFGSRRGFTLIEVMLAVAIIATAVVALLGLQHQSLLSVIRGQDVTRAALLAQEIMTEAELERFPALGQTRGDFQKMHPGEYPNFRWYRAVEATALFPDVRKVTVRVAFGPRLTKTFDLIEFMHSPIPPEEGQTQ
ncbi:MAG TPA: prepilin-type N-terminal cleavage/methylation domain-containing protein [Candidatus Binataceae bacterium]|nr:prepilin-type N-terminal cleavage/methylation domain-containing protein [Candidatus Binataceae bacterium]